jgi:hypothetical protein
VVSYRTALTKFGIPKTAMVSYRGFVSRSKSLRHANRSMDAPTSQQWSQVLDIFRDDFWADEVQGVAWDGTHWIFSANANQTKPGHNDKATMSSRAPDASCGSNARLPSVCLRLSRACARFDAGLERLRESDIAE